MMRVPATVLKTSLVILAFGYGVGVGRWEWPPFNALLALKRVLLQTVEQPDLHASARLSLFEHTTGTADVVMLGDSLTEHGNWAEMFPGVRIFNRGIGRDTSSGVLGRLDEVIARRPRLVLLMIGLNDLQSLVSPSDIEANVSQIVERLQRQGILVGVQSVLQVRAGLNDLNAKISLLNERLRRLTEKSGSKFIDVNVVLESGSGLPSRYSLDGVHLNGVGYQFWRTAIISFIQ